MKIDLAWMIRTGHAVPGGYRAGRLSWECNGQPSGDISYSCDMGDPENAVLELRFTTGASRGDPKDHKQRIQLSYTTPTFGGKRWWIHCPINGDRVGKLYVPPGGDIFASRKAWRIGYRSQRVTKRGAIFERLFRVQEKLGCERGWGNWITRPKGMHHRTFERYLDEYEHLDALCGAEMMRVLGVLQAIR